jgi:hypothetical protein
MEIGDGAPGPVTLAIQKRFMAIAKGQVPDPYGWLTPLPATVAAGG